MSDDSFFVAAIVFVITVMICSLVAHVSITSFTDKTGSSFCESFDLEYEKTDWQSTPGEFRFICINKTTTKIDGIGMLGGIGSGG